MGARFLKEQVMSVYATEAEMLDAMIRWYERDTGMKLTREKIQKKIEDEKNAED